LAKEGEDVRRIARQTARALSEQTEAVAMLAAAATKQTASISEMASGALEQATGSQQILKAVNDMRAKSRQVLLGLVERGKATAAAARDVSGVTVRITEIRAAVASQSETLRALSGGLREMKDGAPNSRPSVEPT
jgi:methyl-accepting chemotaxis protein